MIFFLIYKPWWDIAQHSRTCLNLAILPYVDNILLQQESQLKLLQLGELNSLSFPCTYPPTSIVAASFFGGLLQSLKNVGLVQSQKQGSPTALWPIRTGSFIPWQSSGLCPCKHCLCAFILKSSPLVYPISLLKNTCNPEQIYIASMHTNAEDNNNAPFQWSQRDTAQLVGSQPRRMGWHEDGVNGVTERFQWEH